MENHLHNTPEPEINYHALFEQATDAIMITDLEGVIKDVNPGVCSMFGYSKQELLQMNALALVDVQHLQETPPQFDLVERGEKILNERRMLHKNGTIIYAEINVQKTVENRVLSIIRDVTRRKKIEDALREQEANLETIFETTDTIYVLMDKDLRIISYNARAIDFTKKELGYDFKVSEFFLDYFPENKRADLMLKMKQALAGHSINYESSYRQPDGMENWYHSRIFPISRNDVVYGLMMAVSDITEKKMLQNKLLDHKIGEQKKITRAVLNAQEVERNKIGQELHDNVNQLLSTVRLYLGMVGNLSNAQKEVLDKAKENIDLAINEIREISRKQVTPPRRFNLKEWIEDLCAILNQSTNVKTVFHCNVDDHLPIDEDLKLNIYRIVQEQSNNILKYAEASTATISIHEANQLLHVLIIDNGKGFDPLVRRKGIGISNMTNRVESYNGEMHLESRPGEGCKIEMKIPVPENAN